MAGVVAFTVNGERVELGPHPEGTLLEWLRDERGLVGAKNGCGVGQCGACTVLVNDEPTRACVVKPARLDGARVETVEALAPGGSLHPIQRAFVDEGAIQCGFCTPGLVMATKALLAHVPEPSDEEIRLAIKPNLCRCTGYASIVRAVRRAAGLPVVGPEGSESPGAGPTHAGGAIGGSPVRKDAVAKVTGARVFADDYDAPGRLHGAFAFSEHHHARLLAVDTQAASSAPGVVRVFTAADIPGRNGFGLQEPHQPVLADEVVRYRGEPIAFVVAESARAARAAAGRISASYEPLEVLTTPQEALAEGARGLHPEGNIATEVRFSRGDVERAFAEADLVVEGEYETPAVDHAYLEPESCLAVPGGEGDTTVTVYTANQGSGAFQRMIAACLAVPAERVRVVYTPAGGGFGGKEEPTVQIQAALAAVELGRPVKVALDRAESLRLSTKRHAARIRMRHAVRNDGTLLAIETDVVCDAGAYLSLSRPVVFRTVVMAGGPYEIPNVRLVSKGVYTNTNPAGAFRGFGSTQICFASEVQLDKIARRLAIDPIEIRRRNALAAGKVTPMGHRLNSGIGYLATIDAVERALAEERRRTEPTAGRKLGIGFASAYKNVGIGKGLADEASAAVELGPGGRYTVYVGATDIGQGSDTVMAQIAAETLGAAYEAIDVVSSDTARCPDAGMTTASRQTYVSGNAVAAAARTLAQRITDSGLDAQAFYERHAPQAPGDGRGSSDDAGAADVRRGSGDPGRLRAEERYRPPETAHLPEVFESVDTSGPDGLPVHFAYCFTTMAAIVEAAPDGSDVRVLKLITAQDVGRALHRANVFGQVEGAAVMGAGYALSERFSCGRSGRATLSLNAIGVPRSTDAPELVSFIVEEPTNNGPFGAKGIGEIPLNPAAPAIASAIYDAIGVRTDRLPLEPEKG